MSIHVMTVNAQQREQSIEIALSVRIDQFSKLGIAITALDLLEISGFSDFANRTSSLPGFFENNNVLLTAGIILVRNQQVRHVVGAHYGRDQFGRVGPYYGFRYQLGDSFVAFADIAIGVGLRNEGIYMWNTGIGLGWRILRRPR